MKKVNNINLLMFLFVALTLGACKKGFEEINTDPKNATSASTPELYNAVVSSLPISAGEYSVMNAWLYPITQQGIIVGKSYPYDNARDEVWKNYYYTLANYRLIQSRIESDATMNNVYAMLKTIMAYRTFKTTNYYGDMPYTKAGYGPLDGSSGYKVQYDKQADIYPAILTDLKWAVDNFSTASNQVSLGTYETFLNNDITTWIKFANSLRLYIAVTMYDKNAAVATAHITEALSKPLLDDNTNIGLWPSKITNLEFQWRQWSFSANCYLRLGSTMWNLMSSNNNTNGSGIFDPRCKLFFETNNANQWSAYPQNPPTSTPAEGGAPYDVSKRTANWSNKGTGNLFSNFNVYFELDTKYIPELILTAAQVHFIKAEVYNRGLGVAANQATAKAEYEAGIAASLNMWTSIAYNSPIWTVNKPANAMATVNEINAVKNNSVNAYSSNATTALSQIYAQLWIDQYRQPFDAWTLLRRTGGKTPMSSSNTQYYSSNFGTYNRFLYPDAEASYNFENWKAATGGTDANTTKIWIQP